MELNHHPIDTPPRASASVVLLRNANAGLEVFLMKRHGLSDVLGGAYVFPGGKVDKNDAEPSLTDRMDRMPHALQASLHEPDVEPPFAASLFAAALREAFEECGVLFAQSASLAATDASLADAQTAQQAMALLRQGHAFDEVLFALNLRLLASHLAPWSRWITPRLASVTTKRFDTRFFVAEMPTAQVATHDNHETTESIWLTPRAALTQYRDGVIDLAPPQIMGLAHLSRYTDVAHALADARSRPPPVIEPEPFQMDGLRSICYPGDPRHSNPTRALPGPTRLHFRNQRFEVEGGFEALFG
jgi:8-oxo-dGTP pyrophosphatase MutT (NUDIX family)